MPEFNDRRQTLIDRSNFGLFPGQYATALASHYRCTKTQLIQNLKWLDWQPDRELRNFSLGGVKPTEIELFDKSFSVHWLDCCNRSIAVICLHSVPAFNFGQKQSPNALRNADQLAFLQWFLLGEPRPRPEVLRHLQELGIEPLAANQAFIAVGDFNTPLGDSRYPGGKIIQAMLEHPRIQPRQAMIDAAEQAYLPAIEPNTSFFSSGWDTRKLATQLDYLLVSKELQIERMSVIYAAPQALIHAVSPNWQELSSQLSRYHRQDRVAKILSNNGAKAGQEFKLVSAERDFALLREASDHLPLILDFSYSD
jgi:endonuclease/exonuclease/phosphatase family metal-dependent hydrolase